MKPPRPNTRILFHYTSVFSYKVDGEEIRREKSHSHGKWDSGYKNVSVMSGNDLQLHNSISYVPDIQIKNLVYENLLKVPEWAGGVWKEKED